MLFVITLEHSPELCLARKEYVTGIKTWQESVEERAKSLGIKIHGAYVSMIEHIFYFVLETDNVKAISEFFSPPMLTHHKARISPVIETKVAVTVPYIKEP